MKELLKYSNPQKYMTAIKIADTVRNGVYAAVIVMAVINTYRLFKAVSNS